MKAPNFTIDAFLNDQKVNFPLTGAPPLKLRLVYQDTDGGQPDWIEWLSSRQGNNGPWTVEVRNPGNKKEHAFQISGETTVWLKARAANAAGAHETGLERKVVAKNAAVVDPPSTPRAGRFAFITTIDGMHRLSARVDLPGTPLMANGSGDGPFEEFEVRAGAGAQVGFRSTQNDRWMSAQPDGSLVVDRQRPPAFVPEAWEAFTLVPMEPDRFCIQTVHGKFVRAVDGGGGRVVADEDTAGPQLSFKSSIQIIGGRLQKRAGIVRADRHVVADDSGPFLPLGTTLFPLAYLFKFERDRLEQNLEFLRGRVHFVRALASVGGGGWEDRAIDPRWPDWSDVIAGATDLCWDKYGIRVEWCVFGNTVFVPNAGDRERVVRRLAEIGSGRPEKVLCYEVMNEAWQNGLGDARSEAKALSRLLRKSTPNLVAVTSPDPNVQTSDDATTAEVRSWYEGSEATMLTVHPSRDQNGTGGVWRPVRQPWEIQFYGGNPPAVWNLDEPIGPRSSGGMDDDPSRLATFAACGPVCGAAVFVLHTGAGVRMGGAADQSSAKSYLPREKNLFDVPRMDAILKGVTAMNTALPAECPNWSRQNSNVKFPNHPFDVNELPEEKVLRVYATVGGQSFAGVCIQVMTDINLRAKRPMHVRVLNPGSGDVVEERDLNPGEAIVVHGTHDQPTGFVFVGSFR